MAWMENSRRPGDLSRFGVVTSLVTIAYMVLLTVLEQAGLPPGYAFALTVMVLTGGIALAGIGAATTRAETWFAGAQREEPLALGMAGAATLLATCFFIAIPGAFFAGSPAAAAWVLGPLAGVAAGGLLIAPHLARAPGGSAGSYLRERFRSPLPRLTAMAVATIICFLAVWSQLSLAGSVAALFLPLGRTGATLLAAFLVLLVVAPGGLAGLMRVNAAGFAFAATAILAPAIWISTVQTWVPVPQIGFGAGAMVPLDAIESQAAALGIRTLADSARTLLAPDGSPAAIVAMTLFLALAFAAFPPLWTHVRAGRALRPVRPGVGWTIGLAALVLTAAPALAAFAKLAMYDGLLGLTPARIESGAGWLLDWSRLQSPFDQSRTLALLCGQSVGTAAEALTACGGDAEMALTAANLAIEGEAIALALPQIALLPTVFSIVGGAAAILLSLAAASAGALALARTVVLDAPAVATGRPVSGLRRLFGARLLLLVSLAASLGLSIATPVTPVEIALHGLALAGGILFPALVAAIFDDRLHPVALTAGMVAGLLAYGASLVLARLGPDLALATGDEIRLGFMAAQGFPDPVVAGMIALACGFVTGGLASIVLRLKPDPEKLEMLRAPDRMPPAGTSSI